MTHHLSECPHRTDHPILPKNRELICICPELRACEQRMLDDDVLAAAYHGEKGYAMGYAVALNAAEAAVMEAGPYWLVDDVESPEKVFVMKVSNALAAINTLKEKP